MPKEMLIVGGPNGAGKTTFALEYVAARGCSYLSADAIAAELSPNNPARAAVEAGNEFLNRLSAMLTLESSFVVESTLSGRTFEHWIRQAQSSGFTVSIAYVFLESAETCIQRVRERADKGGHFVPDHDVRRRFGRSLVNFWQIYRLLADHWVLMYNSRKQLQDVATGNRIDHSVSDMDLFDRFQQLLENAERG